MRRAILLASILLGLGGVPAVAATEAPFTPSAFTAAQQSGEPILVWVHASWCPTCAKQQPILSKLENEPAYRNLKVFLVDFDSQKNVVRSMGVQMQSTLIAFHGSKEAARSTGQTDETAIRSVVSKTEG
jgi:thioredoxin 1